MPNYFNSTGAYEIKYSLPSDCYFVFLFTGAEDKTLIARFYSEIRAKGWIDNGAKNEDLYEEEKP